MGILIRTARPVRGTQKYKRYFRLKSYDDAPWDYLKQLIEEAAQFDPRSLQA